MLSGGRRRMRLPPLDFVLARMLLECGCKSQEKG